MQKYAHSCCPETKTFNNPTHIYHSKIRLVQYSDPHCCRLILQYSLKSRFPLWGGWYASKDDSSQPYNPDRDSNEANLSSLEDEIIGALSDEATFVPYKDLIFAQLGFSLKSGTLRLFSRGQKTGSVKGKLIICK